MSIRAGKAPLNSTRYDQRVAQITGQSPREFGVPDRCERSRVAVVNSGAIAGEMPSRRTSGGTTDPNRHG